MKNFVYTAYDGAGAKHQGELSAINIESAKFKLKELGLIPVKIDYVDNAANKVNELLQFNRGPRLSEVEFLTSQLSLLLKNGIKIDRALEIAKKGIRNNRLRKIVDEVCDDVRRGTPLSVSLEKNLDVFDLLYVSIVRIGEATGRLPDIFADLASNLNFRQKISVKTRQAMIYPSIIFIVCLLSVLFIFNFIVPKFTVFFSGMKDLPIYTDILLGVSDIFRKYQFIMLSTIVGFSILIVRIRKKDRFRNLMDVAALRVPITRQLCYTLENLRFTSSLAILLKSGVVLTEALDYAIKSIGNIFLRKQLMIVKNEIKQGKKFSAAMAKTGFLPDVFDGLMEVGEQTGNLSEVFSEMEKRLRSLYEERVTSLITVIEPIMIIFMGLVVGSVVVVMLLSMVSISDINF
ncbi:MAG: type II secretion system F family protein [Desulfobacteraceae bacterium]|nr:type II secretion system F family protein [Desulfobacteraceae bacterium]MBC2720727.1 type II secretion system F family protein [Desulfobacteraceae bacterium]